MEDRLFQEIEELLNNMKKFQSKLSYIDSIRDDSDKIREMKDIVIDKAGDFWDTFNKHSEYTKDNFNKSNLKLNEIEKNIYDAKNNFDNLLKIKTEEVRKKAEDINSFFKEELNIVNNKLSDIERDFNNLLNIKIEELNNNINIKAEEINKKAEDINSSLREELNIVNNKLSDIEKDFNNALNSKIEELSKKSNYDISKLNKKLLFISIFSPIISILVMILIIKMNIF